MMTLVHSMAAGGDFISDIDMVRAGATAHVLWASGHGGHDGRHVPARSVVVMSASSTGSPMSHWAGRGRRALGRGRNH